ncbi:mandelate racemase [Sporocytophaga myxococcoides]|uniref:Mandelate racemase n=1 Tax=Sporocytophaga myxococcoides TaxID=153721 RepID=A0A098LG45_9BACT|nr:enolase C-terminal domain-like protein [Sporocytophaga myxococcoides]GAL85946.1 mandelate racemase [Sporocytophaga myxococcoides]
MERNIVLVKHVHVSAYKIPTQTFEADGTLDWDHTILVYVEISGGGKTGIGYSYASYATAILIKEMLSERITGMNVFDIPSIGYQMIHAIRNQGRDGISSMAISAIDTALWDLKAKLLDISLVKLLGSLKEKVAVYGSGGFTNYSDQQLEDQVKLWQSFGMNKIKIKIGRNAIEDESRILKLQKYYGGKTEIFVDANGAYLKKEALYYSKRFAELGVVWFEEPVSSDDIDSLKYITEKVPPPINITAGEYGYNLFYFNRMLKERAVDILQIDASRCGGFSEMIKAINLAETYNIPVSTHCAPSLHLHVACATNIIHMEYFFDHYKIEKELFDGAITPVNGYLKPDYSRPGIGLELKKKDAEKFLYR